jgi:hypothetical protein
MLKQKKTKLERRIEITPAFDKRSDVPSKNYGIGSCNLHFAVIGDKGAVTVYFFTNWFLPSTVKEYREIGINRNVFPGYGKEPFKTKINLEKQDKPISAGSWDYHSKKKMYDGQSYSHKCEYTKGKCYCDGSCLKGDTYLKLLIEKGSDAVFEELEKDYRKQFKVRRC